MKFNRTVVVSTTNNPDYYFYLPYVEKAWNNYGWNVYPAAKGPDSIRSSIDLLKKWKLNVTQRSTNLRKELNGYKWKQNKDGVLLNEPVDLMNHAIDAVRYIALNKLNNNYSGEYSIDVL